MVLLILWVDLQTSKCPSPGMLLEITHSHASRPEAWCVRVKLSGFNTRHSGSAEATWRVSVPPAARSSAPAHDARRECQLHVAKSMSFPRKSGNSDICANTLICKWWQVMSFSFLLNTMQPSSLGHHVATSALGILSGGREMFQNVSTPLPSRAFPLCSLTPRGTSQEATSLPLGRVWALEKVKSRSFKDPNPAPSLLPLDRAICNLTPSQTRVSAGLNFSKEGEPYSVHMPLTDHCGASDRDKKVRRMKTRSLFSMYRAQGKSKPSKLSLRNLG